MRVKVIRSFTVLLLFLHLSISVVSASTVSILTWWLNGNDGMLRYYSYTKYYSNADFGCRTWNKYTKTICSRVYDSSINKPVIISDENVNGSAFGTAFSSGKIVLYKSKMDPASETTRNHVLLHELGHALGLAHNREKDVMYMYMNNVIVPTENDIASLKASSSRYR